MKKLENLFKEAKGIILFYIIVVILAIILTNKIEDIDSKSQRDITNKTYYAYNR